MCVEVQMYIWELSTLQYKDWLISPEALQSVAAIWFITVQSLKQEHICSSCVIARKKTKA
jgi:hypothetical protein